MFTSCNMHAVPCKYVVFIIRVCKGQKTELKDLKRKIKDLATRIEVTDTQEKMQNWRKTQPLEENIFLIYFFSHRHAKANTSTWLNVPPP